MKSQHSSILSLSNVLYLNIVVLSVLLTGCGGSSQVALDVHETPLPEPVAAEQQVITPDANKETSLVDPSPERLVLAARYGQMDLVNYLLEGGMNVDARDAYGNTALIAAAGNGQTDMVVQLLSRGAKIDAANKEEQTALMGAASSGDFELVNRLIQEGAKVNAVNNQGETALFKAVQYGHYKAAKVLLNRGAANPNLRNTIRANEPNSGFTPLIYAATGGLTKADVDWQAMVQLLLNNNADPNMTNTHGESALIFARQNGNQAIFDTLKQAGAKDNQAYVRLGMDDALIKAARLGDQYKLDQLIANGANVNYVDTNGLTPLLAAAFEGHLLTVNTLLESGAEVNFVPLGLRQFAMSKSHAPLANRELMAAASRGDTALIAAGRQNNIDVVKALLKNKADSEIANRHGETVMFLAAIQGNSDLVDVLLRNGANPNELEKENRSNRLALARHSTGQDSVLIKAIQGGFVNVAVLLLDAGADINYRGFMGKTALFTAIENSHVTLVKLLILHGVDANTANFAGITPLMVAAKLGNGALVEALINHKANVNTIVKPDLGYASDSDGSNGMTALMFASRGGHEKIVNLLLTAGAEINIHDENGMSAADQAEARGYTNIVNMIQASGRGVRKAGNVSLSDL